MASFLYFSQAGSFKNIIVLLVASDVHQTFETHIHAHTSIRTVCFSPSLYIRCEQCVVGCMTAEVLTSESD